MAEGVVQKAKRMLGTGKVTVTAVSPQGGVTANVQGDHNLYRVTWRRDDAGDGWSCSCYASTEIGKRCSHIRAVQLVTLNDKEV